MTNSSMEKRIHHEGQNVNWKKLTMVTGDKSRWPAETRAHHIGEPQAHIQECQACRTGTHRTGCQWDIKMEWSQVIPIRCTPCLKNHLHLYHRQMQATTATLLQALHLPSPRNHPPAHHAIHRRRTATPSRARKRHAREQWALVPGLDPQSSRRLRSRQ